MRDTLERYDKITQNCLGVFQKKIKDYGAAWRVLRLPSLTDQILIKAKRIRQLQQIKESKIKEGQEVEFMGIVNYSVMALLQLQKGVVEIPDIEGNQAVALYKIQMENVRDLMKKKNHDYGEAWRDMRVNSLTDLILQKLLRIKHIENNNGKTAASEGVGANYKDIINYAIFSIIHIQDSKM